MALINSHSCLLLLFAISFVYSSVGFAGGSSYKDVSESWATQHNLDRTFECGNLWLTFRWSWYFYIPSLIKKCIKNLRVQSTVLSGSKNVKMQVFLRI